MKMFLHMRALVAVLLFTFMSLPALAANTVTLNADLVSGNGSVSPTLTWSTSPVASSCVASGGWTGTKAPSGSQLIPAITASTTFVLNCSWTTGNAQINWTAPTKNTDGSTLTDLTGFNIYQQFNSGAFSKVASPGPLLTTTTLTGLAPGAYGFQMTAFNSGNIESTRTSTAVVTITAPNVSQQISITVNPAPQAPTNVTAVQVP
jgi:hypothetical protein